MRSYKKCGNPFFEAVNLNGGWLELNFNPTFVIASILSDLSVCTWGGTEDHVGRINSLSLFDSFLSVYGQIIDFSTSRSFWGSFMGKKCWLLRGPKIAV